MLSLKVIDTDEFLDMPQSSQYLYFNMSMRADDDGFISNPKRIMKMVGCNDDDIKVLVAKRFVIPFESGVCVIRHWRIHNLIRADRYSETEYIEEKSTLALNNSKYEPNNTNVIPNGNQMAPQDRLGKDRLGKVKVIADKSAGEIPEIIKLFEEVNPLIGKMYGNKTQRAAVQRMLKVFGREKLEDMINALPAINSKQYYPKSTTPCQLENNIPIYKAKNDEFKNKGNKKINIIKI